MKYQIHFARAGRDDLVVPWDKPFGDAIDHAKSHILQQLALGAKIIDDKGQVVWRAGPDLP
jgi:hypothetical protein